MFYILWYVFTRQKDGIKHSLSVLATKSDSALSCLLSNPITIPDKFRAELHLWSGSEGVYRNSHPVISVCNKTRRFCSPLRTYWRGQPTDDISQLICWVRWGMGSGGPRIVTLGLQCSVIHPSLTPVVSQHHTQTGSRDHAVGSERKNYTWYTSYRTH